CCASPAGGRCAARPARSTRSAKPARPTLTENPLSQSQPDTKPKAWTTPVILFLIVFLVYVMSPVIQSSDSRLAVHVSMSILRQGNIDLDEYADWIGDYYAAAQVGNHLYNRYPIGVSLLA